MKTVELIEIGLDGDTTYHVSARGGKSPIDGNLGATYLAELLEEYGYNNIPFSSDFRDGQAAAGSWYEAKNGRLVLVSQVVGASGVYLLVADAVTDIVLRDDRPWQMTV